MTDKATKRLRKRLILIYEHPDWCLENHTRALTDTYLYTVASRPHQIYGVQYGDVRTCNTCGKKYNDAPALA